MQEDVLINKNNLNNFFNKSSQKNTSLRELSIYRIFDFLKPSLLTKEKIKFCYIVILQTLESCIEATYTNFDAHTTANCCHGMAVLTKSLISAAMELDLTPV